MAFGYSTPNITYKSIKINNTDISLSSTTKVSFISPFNKINITIRPTTCSISYYEVRVTKDTEDYDIGVGNCAYFTGSLSVDQDYSFSININNTLFNKGDGKYRISLYGKSSLDGSWDVTYLLFTVDNEQVIDSNNNGIEMLTIQDAPEN